jgi:rhodanese-related sulfurtransferase
MSVPRISPIEARRRLADGTAVLVDIRGPMEHARESIPGAKSDPISSLDPSTVAASLADTPAVIFHCQTGKRTADNEAQLAKCPAPEVFLLEGGLNAWKSAGFPTKLDKSKPIELQRQVQIAAGTLVLAGLALGAFVSPWFSLISAFVGSGLVFAGLSGWCGMANLLSAMPWNRAPAS